MGGLKRNSLSETVGILGGRETRSAAKKGRGGSPLTNVENLVERVEGKEYKNVLGTTPLFT